MKILVFEYITGGGFNKQALPESLADEGLLMLRALLEGLTVISDIDVTVMLDWRIADAIEWSGVNTAVVESEHDCHDRFAQLAEIVDAVWPVAPEFNQILLTLCRSVEKLGKILLASDSNAVALASDKYETFHCMSRYRIPAVATRLFDDCRIYPGECVIKPLDGAGCADSYLIMGPEDFAWNSKQWHGLNSHIIQPHLKGDKTSLSCLFKEGRAWLLSVNLQKFNIVNNQYRLSEIIVNYSSELSSYQSLADGIAIAVPGLWGYAGIDLIETPDQRLVLEINPRLTTSFAGIGAALGINTADLVLQLLQGEPVFDRTAGRPVAVKIGQNSNEI
ncbi:MAG: ATP-grasp domain-containing protein [Gammaproteobacteria bacterium]